MKRLKEKILEDNQLPTPSPADGSTPSNPSCTPPTPSSTGDPTPSTPSYTTRSNDTYVYSVGTVPFLVIGVCVFFAYNTFQPKIKKQANDCLTAQHEQKKDQPPKRRLML